MKTNKKKESENRDSWVLFFFPFFVFALVALIFKFNELYANRTREIQRQRVEQIQEKEFQEIRRELEPTLKERAAEEARTRVKAGSLAKVKAPVVHDGAPGSVLILGDKIRGQSEYGITLFHGSVGGEKVVLNSDTNAIGTRAFAESRSEEEAPDDDENYLPSRLKEVVFPGALKAIGDFAFWNCPIKKVFIPPKVSVLGIGAFSGACGEFVVSWENQYFTAVDGVLFTRDMSTLVCYPSMSPAEEYRVPDGVQTIADYAFAGAFHLKKVELPESVVNVGENSFTHCDSLTSINLPDVSVSDDGESHTAEEREFDGSRNVSKDQYAIQDILRSLAIQHRKETANAPEERKERPKLQIDPWETQFTPFRFVKSQDGVVVTGGSASEFVIPEGAVKIAEKAFEYSRVQALETPSSLREIGERAFWIAEKLKSVKFAEGLEKIDSAAFAYCRALETLETPKSLVEIGSSAFQGCESLKSVKLSKGLKTIGENAFFDCESLVSVELPEGLTTIGDYAFAYCPLTTVMLPSTVTSVGPNAFPPDCRVIGGSIQTE